MIEYIKRLYMKWLKEHNFGKYWKIHCDDMYCKKCQYKAENGCHIDYITGKCVNE